MNLKTAIGWVTSEPHRLFFATGTLLMISSVFWWITYLGHLYFHFIPSYAFNPKELHVFLMVYVVLTCYGLGFLLTTFPRWLNRPALTRKKALLFFLLIPCGGVLAWTSTKLGTGVLVIGSMLVTLGFLLWFLHLAEIWVRSDSPDKTQPLFALLAVFGGLAGASCFALYVHHRAFDAAYLAAYGLGVYFFFPLLILTLAWRLVPFFTSVVMGWEGMNSLTWVLPAWALLLALKTALFISGNQQGFVLSDGLLLFITLYQYQKWRFWRRKPKMILSMLYISLAWFPLGFGLHFVGGLVALSEGYYSLRWELAGLHALAIGCFTSMVFAMTTRVTLGHSGRPMETGRFESRLFWILQGGALFRVACELLGLIDIRFTFWSFVAGFFILIALVCGLGAIFLSISSPGKISRWRNLGNNMTREEFQKLIAEQILVIDGAMGTMIQAYEFGPEVYGGEEFQMLSDLLVFSKPKAIQEVHLAYLQAGAHAIETNSFGASPLRLAEFDLSKIDLSEYPQRADGIQVNQLSLKEFSRLLSYDSAQIARTALAEHKKSNEYDGRPLLVLGSLGPSNWVLSTTHADLHKGAFSKIQENFYIQCLGLIEGGADILLFETQQDALELKAAVFGAKQAMEELGMEIPIICQVTVDQYSKMQIFHTDILAALTSLQHIGIDAFGINCSIGPDLMGPTVEKICKHSQIAVSIVPNAGLPQSENGQTVFKLTPQDMAQQVKKFAEMGANLVGGCCGTTPAHIRAIAEQVKGLKPLQRKIDQGLYIAGPQQAVLLDSKEGLIRIGERLNVRGSKKVRDAVESGGPIDQDILEEVISEQIKDLGVEILDVCMDSNQVDTAETLVQVIQAQTVDFSGAFCLDSFDVDALAKAIEVYPGRPIINSISMEEWQPGVNKVDAILEVTKAFAPLYIGLTTGPKGPAVTKEEKLDLAQQIVARAAAHGVPADWLLIDINAFPIGSESSEEMNFATESLESIPLIKKACPGVKISIGVGNLTNGLAKKPYMRKVLTSVFLDEGRKLGLDAAIINPHHYVPVESLAKADYELGRKVVLERDMDAFARLEEIAEAKKGGPVKKKTNYADLSPPASVCQKIKDGFKERTQGEVNYQGFGYAYSDAIVKEVVESLEGGLEPLQFVNDHLMVAMQALGQGFAEGMVSLPHLLKSADVMKQVMGFLEAFLKHKSGADAGGVSYKGVIVLGTVYQDVHSIGKDLAKTLLENYGYKVFDLGVQVPLERFIEVAKQEKADALGLSALLVQTSNHMITLAKMMAEEGMNDLPVLVGGAPVSNRHAAFVAMAGQEDESQMRDNIFYCPSAMDGVNVMNSLMEESRKGEFLAKNKENLTQALHQGQRRAAAQEKLLRELPTRKVEVAEPATPKDKQIHEILLTLREFRPRLQEKQLFALNWKFGGAGSWGKKGESLQSLLGKLDQWVERIDKEGWFAPSAVWRVMDCKPEKEHLILLEEGKEVGRLRFNPIIGQGQKDQFQFNQFFNPAGDVVGLQLSTAGPEVDQAIMELKDHDQEAAWIVQGLSDRVAEDMAAYAQEVMQAEGFAHFQEAALRCSPGYPALREMANNSTIFHLLSAGDRLRIRLTTAHEFEPTGSTGAIVAFHPKASFH